jgi:CheY-like chemotaxis protein
MEEYSKSVPLISFPTKVLFIDDDENFFDIVGNSIDLGENIVFSCLDYKNHVSVINSQNNIIVDEILSSDPYNDPENSDINLNYFDIQNLMLNNYKNNYYSVVFVDYDMQVRNGLEILKDIENPYVYKVLLTGVADETIAIQAFKDGLIDDYIRKQDFNLLNEIEKTIEKGKLHFFNKHSEFIKKYLKQNMVKNTPINDTTYQSFLLKNMCNNHIEEFYMIESSGSYFLITDKGKKRILHVCSKEDIRSYAETYRDDLEKMNLYENIITGEKIICAYSDNKENLPEKICKDSNFIYDANQILGSNTYYYAFIDV